MRTKSKAAEPGVRRAERWIQAVTRPDGTAYFRLDFRDQQGRRVREYAGTTITEARTLRDDREYEVKRGTYEHPDDKKAREEDARRKAEAESDRGPTFAEFVENEETGFLVKYGDLRRSTYYRAMLSPTRPLMMYFGSRHVREITEADLDAYRRSRAGTEYQGKKVSDSTVRKDLVCLGTMFRLARRWGVIQTNPALDVEKPREPEPKGRPFTVEEWGKARAELPPWLASIAVFALATGSRLKEAVGLRWEDVRLREGFLYFSPENKTARSKRVVIGEAARGILEAQDRTRRDVARRTERLPEYVFTDETGAAFDTDRQRNKVSQRFRAAMAAAGFPWASFKALRTTAASWAEEEGVSVGEAKALLGHSDVRTTQRFYMRSEADKTRGIVSALDRKLSGLDTKRTLDPEASTEHPTAALDSGR